MKSEPVYSNNVGSMRLNNVSIIQGKSAIDFNFDDN